MLTNYYCENCEIKTETSICPICGNRTKSLLRIYWCKECNIPIIDYDNHNVDHHLESISSDIRPVFPEERLLLELILDQPFKYVNSSCWRLPNGIYFIDGKKKTKKPIIKRMPKTKSLPKRQR